jgi:hypothetical protein
MNPDFDVGHSFLRLKRKGRLFFCFRLKPILFSIFYHRLKPAAIHYKTKQLEAVSKILCLLWVLCALAWYFKDFHAKAQRIQRKVQEMRAALYFCDSF